VTLPKDKHLLNRARLFLVAIAILLGNPAFSKGILESGNDYILACRAFTSRHVPANILEAAEVGQCIGAVKSIMSAGFFLVEQLRFCPPDHASFGQGANVILKYMDDHPGQTDQDFFALGLKAFRLTWPCKHE
jgi:hypothetical protein